MAINTRDRRASAGACGLVMLVALPIPDSTISAADRAHSAGFYAGIAVVVPSPDIGPPRLESIAMLAATLANPAMTDSELAALAMLQTTLDNIDAVDF